MVTITINIENGNEASEACREVARMIDNGYTNGMIGCSWWVAKHFLYKTDNEFHYENANINLFELNLNKY